MERDARTNRVGDLQSPAEREIRRRGSRCRQGQAACLPCARAAAALPFALRAAARALLAAPPASR